MVLAKRLSEKQKQEIIDAFINNQSLEEISKKFNFSRLTITRHLKKSIGDRRLYVAIRLVEKQVKNSEQIFKDTTSMLTASREEAQNWGSQEARN